MSGERILVVDDGADMRDFVINYVLNPYGYFPLEARDGMEAFQIIIQNPPDLIITDLQMPRLDGIGLLRKMREQSINIPVVLMTFHGSEEIAIEVFRLGVRDYVIKPFNEEDLVAAIERGLSEARLRRQRDVLRRVGKMVASLPDLDTLLKEILQATVELSGVAQAGMFIVSDDGRSLIGRAMQIGGQTRLDNRPVQNPLASQAIQTAQPVTGPQQTDPASGRTLIPVYVPMIAGNTSFGALFAEFLADVVTEEQYNLLLNLVDYAAIGFERARLATLLQGG